MDPNSGVPMFNQKLTVLKIPAKMTFFVKATRQWHYNDYQGSQCCQLSVENVCHIVECRQLPFYSLFQSGSIYCKTAKYSHAGHVCNFRENREIFLHANNILTKQNLLYSSTLYLKIREMFLLQNSLRAKFAQFSCFTVFWWYSNSLLQLNAYWQVAGVFATCLTPELQICTIFLFYSILVVFKIFITIECLLASCWGICNMPDSRTPCLQIFPFLRQQNCLPRTAVY